MDFTKKKLHQEMDDKMETEQQNKRHLERKVIIHTLYTVSEFKICHNK